MSIVLSSSAVKVILAWIIWTLGLLSVFAPRWCLTGQPAFFSLGNMMASGVLLSAGLVHQLADSSEAFAKQQQIIEEEDAAGTSSFPWAMFLAGLTFSLFLVLEESLHLALESGSSGSIGTIKGGGINLHEAMHGGGSHGAGAHSHSHSHSHSSHSQQQQDDKQKRPHHEPTTMTTNTKAYDHDPVSSEDHALLHELQNLYNTSSIVQCSHGTTTVSCSSGMTRKTITMGEQQHEEGMIHHRQPWCASSVGAASSVRRRSFLQTTKSHREDPYVLTDHHHHDDHIELHLHGSILASGILLVALSIHSILAGISIGIEEDIEAITGTAIAILAHKSFEGFCLGSSFVTAELDRSPYLVLGIFFSCTTPLGIFIGQWLLIQLEDQADSSTSSVAIAVVQAIVAGTFLYISIVEIGAKELLACRHEPPKPGEDLTTNSQRTQRFEIAKLSCFLFGFLAMSLLANYV